MRRDTEQPRVAAGLGAAKYRTGGKMAEPKARDAVRAADEALEDAIVLALPSSGATLNAQSTAAVESAIAPLEKKLAAAKTKVQELEAKETAALCTHADAIKAAERA